MGQNNSRPASVSMWIDPPSSVTTAIAAAKAACAAWPQSKVESPVPMIQAPEAAVCGDLLRPDDQLPPVYWIGFGVGIWGTLLAICAWKFLRFLCRTIWSVLRPNVAAL